MEFDDEFGFPQYILLQLSTSGGFDKMWFHIVPKQRQELISQKTAVPYRC